MVTSKASANKISWIVWAHAQAMADTLREPFLVLDDKFQVLLANKRFYKLFQTKPEDTEGRKIDALADGKLNISKLRSALDDAMSKKTLVKNVELTYDLTGIGTGTFIINARAIYRENGLTPIIVLAIEDVITRKSNDRSAQRAAKLEKRVKELERLNKAMVGRELKMMELKREIRELKRAVKKEHGYSSSKPTSK